MQGNSPTGDQYYPPVIAGPGPSQTGARGIRLIPDLRPGEVLVLVQRQHPAVLIRRLTFPALLALVWLAGVLVVSPYLASLEAGASLPYLGSPPSWLPGSLWLAWVGVGAFAVLWGAYRVLDWSDDWIALTNRRLIVMEKVPFLRESRREIPVGRVQNITAQYRNSLGVAFDYGDLKIDTAGIGEVEFRNLPHPKVMREAIFEQQAQLRAGEPSPEDRRRAAVLNIMHGVDPNSSQAPTPPKGNPVVHPGSLQAQDSGFGVFSDILPLVPQRTANSVTWHRHWFFLVRTEFLPVALWFLSVAAWLSAVGSGEGPIASLAIGLGWGVVVLSPVCLFWVVWSWENWRNDYFKLDHERVYDIKSLPLGMREQSKQTLITRVTDVSYVVPSPLAHLLDYGNVLLKTPGEATEFKFRGVPRPREVQQEIMDRIDEYRQKGTESTDREIAAWLRAYFEVQSGGA